VLRAVPARHVDLQDADPVLPDGEMVLAGQVSQVLVVVFKYLVDGQFDTHLVRSIEP
jgi:hypothetical protein